jgi:hypothetical protein
MKTTLSILQKYFVKPRHSKFLLLLLSFDFAFIALHFINNLFFRKVLPSFHWKYFDIDQDRSIPEFFQYIKWLLIIIVLIRISKTKRSYEYLSWALLFLYFLCDDALRIHENVGHFFERNFSIAAPFGLRVQDIGELAITGLAGSIIIPLIFWTYLKGSNEFKKMSNIMIVFIGSLVFFGIIVDLADIAIHIRRIPIIVLEAFEDGGEMLVASLILWFVYEVSFSDKSNPINL